MTHIGRPVAATLAVMLLAVGIVGRADVVAAGVDEPGNQDPCEEVPRAFFVDIGDTSTPAASIDCLVWYEVVQGVTYDRFGVGELLRRDQLASLLDRLVTTAGVGLEPAEDGAVTVDFDDVHGVHAEAIRRLTAAGIIQGRTTDRFEPEAFVRRDQLAALAVRTYDAILAAGPFPEAEPSDVTDPFTDLDGNVHRHAIGRAVALDVVRGATATTFEPHRPSTRGQAAMVLTRLLQRLAADGMVRAGALSAGGYDVRVDALPASLLRDVERWTWSPGCPVAPTDLRLLQAVHTDFDGVDRWGLLVLHRAHAADLGAVLRELHADAFPIARMEPIERFEGDDDASMAANNTSLFNCRRVTGSSRFSEHAYGHAIDINPVQNPYVNGATVLPPAGRDYLDRSDVRPGMLVRPGPVEAFDRIGWGWGGDWTSLKDYQHLSSTGR